MRTTSLFLLLFLFANTAFSQEIDKKLHQQCLYPTIYIESVEKTDRGTGVIIRSEKVSENEYRNVFITCSHLFDYGNNTGYQVKEYQYEDWSHIKTTTNYPCYIYGNNVELDLAVGLFYSKKEMPTAKICSNPKLYIGNDILRIGCGLGDEPRLDYGKLTGYQKKHLRTSIYTVPGDSGGPVFNNYEIVGIMVRIKATRAYPVHAISFAVPIQSFKTWSISDKNTLDFIMDNTKKIPEMPFRWLKMRDYEIQ